MYMHKALATVLLVWCLHFILLLEVMPRYSALFTKGMSHQFIYSMSSGTVNLLEK
jgi:hypothetical protein